MSTKVLLLLLLLVKCGVSTMFQSCGVKFVVDKSTQEEVKMDPATMMQALEEHLQHVNLVYHNLVMFEGEQVKFEVAEVKFENVEWGGGSREEYKEQVKKEEGEECLVYVLHNLPLSSTSWEDGRMCSKENIGFITFNRETYWDTEGAQTRFAMAHQVVAPALSCTALPCTPGRPLPGPGQLLLPRGAGRPDDPCILLGLTTPRLHHHRPLILSQAGPQGTSYKCK